MPRCRDLASRISGMIKRTPREPRYSFSLGLRLAESRHAHLPAHLRVDPLATLILNLARTRITRILHFARPLTLVRGLGIVLELAVTPGRKVHDRCVGHARRAQRWHPKLLVRPSVHPSTLKAVPARCKVQHARRLPEAEPATDEVAIRHGREWQPLRFQNAAIV